MVILRYLSYFFCGALWVGGAGLMQASLVPGHLETGLDNLLFFIVIVVVLLQPLVALGLVCLLLGGIGTMIWVTIRAPVERRSVALPAVGLSKPPKTTRKSRTVPYLILGFTLACVMAVPILVAEKVPRHFAFRQAIPNFEQALISSDLSDVSHVGFYPIRTVTRDSAGRAYFKTGELIAGG